MRNVVLLLIGIDLVLVAGRLLAYPSILAKPGAVITFGWLALGLAAAAAAVIWTGSSKLAGRDLRLPTAIGLAAGALMVGHMALENFGTRVGEDWRLTIAVMLAAFALWFSSGWYAGRNHFTPAAGAAAGSWAAIMSVTLAVMAGFLGMYFNVPATEYVATWPEYLKSGWGDPQAFAFANTIDAATGHIITALLLGPALGGAGGLIGSRQARGLQRHG